MAGAMLIGILLGYFFGKVTVMDRRGFMKGMAGVACCTVVGCTKEEPIATTKTGEQVYRCPVCNTVMEKDAYCSTCNAVAALAGTVHCDKCDMDKEIGSYCAKCNRFLFDDEIKCDKADKTIIKGTFCAKKKAYRRLATVGYCETCKKPFDKATGCPVCGKKQA